MTAVAARPAGAFHALALVKQVPTDAVLTGDLTFDADGRLRRDGLPTEMNPFCRRAVATAVRLARQTGGRSTVLTMGPPQARDVLVESLAWGAGAAVHLCDPTLAGSDTLATARALAAAVRLVGAEAPVDLIAVGRGSVDAETGVVGPQLAQLLDLPFAGPALDIELEDEGGRARYARLRVQLDGGTARLRVSLPAVVALAERACAPAKVPRERWPEHAAVRLITAGDLGPGRWGLAGSPTRVGAARRLGTRRAGVVLDGPVEEQAARAVELLRERGAPPFAAPASPTGEVAPVPPPATAAVPASPPLVVVAGDPPGAGTRALLGEAALLARARGGAVVAVAPAGHAPDLSAWGADAVLAPARPDPAALAAALAPWVARHGAWAVLAEASPWGREVAARTAAALGAGLIADAIELGLDAGAPAGLTGVKPAFAGALAVDIASAGPTRVATVRAGGLPLRPARASRTPEVLALPVEPDPRVQVLSREVEDDWDALDRAEAVIGVGRGIDPEHYPALDPLVRVLRAELAATRKVADAGWLPHARQVGITGRAVAPRLYVALGLSGKANHLVGVRRAATLLAVNVDRAAPVFEGCDIGMVADWRAAVPVLARCLHAVPLARGTRG